MIFDYAKALILFANFLQKDLAELLIDDGICYQAFEGKSEIKIDYCQFSSPISRLIMKFIPRGA